jgi:hypothetical protein
LLLFLAACLHGLHYVIFRDAHHLFIYLLGDIAFVPLEVLLVVVIVERLLERREKQAVMEKMNMLVGMFFSEAGTSLLGDLTESLANGEELARPSTALCFRHETLRATATFGLHLFRASLDAGRRRSPLTS